MDRYTPFGSQPGVSPPEPIHDDRNDEATGSADREERLDYMKNVALTRQSSSHWPLKITGAVIILLLIGLGAWLAFGHSGKAKPKKAATAVVAPSKTTTSNTANYVASGQDLNLSFNYPSTWSATPASGTDTTDQAIMLNSPLTTIASATGASVTGKVTLSIRPGSATLTELASGNATAAQASAQVGYTKPTANQYQYPFITFIHLPTTGNPNGAFQEVLVSGTTQFNAGDSLTAASVSVDPIISASFYDCSSTACTGSSATPLNITNDTWQNATVFKQTLAAIESLQLN